MDQSRNTFIKPFLGLIGLILSLCLCITPALAKDDLGLIDGLDHPYPAPLIMGISAWINTAPVTLSELNGKVVLMVFWASTCPYCKRSLPYINEWYDRYHNHGLMIIGIHSPKTEDEKSLQVVKNAVNDFNIQYPVALDNNFETWDNYNVASWPSFFLIDRKGNVVYAHFGADEFEIIEQNIQYLLSH